MAPNATAAQVYRPSSVPATAVLLGTADSARATQPACWCMRLVPAMGAFAPAGTLGVSLASAMGDVASTGALGACGVLSGEAAAQLLELLPSATTPKRAALMTHCSALMSWWLGGLRGHYAFGCVLKLMTWQLGGLHQHYVRGGVCRLRNEDAGAPSCAACMSVLVRI